MLYYLLLRCMIIIMLNYCIIITMYIMSNYCVVIMSDCCIIIMLNYYVKLLYNNDYDFVIIDGVI